MTIPTEPPPAAPDIEAPQPPMAARGSDRFFLWVAGLGVARSDGWLGGVAAGIAARLRIDPLIVRGVLVVAALFGLPVIFLYALAWALLPDADGRIHARDLLRRDYQPVQLGILAMAVIGLVPTAPLTGTIFGFGYVNWSALAVIGWLAGLAVVIVLLVLIVRAASRTPGASAPDLPMASADQAAPAAPVTLGESGAPEGAGASPSGPPPQSRPEPPAAPAAPDADSMAAWREQHAAWKEQDQAWRRQPQDAERAVRDQIRRERQAEAAVFAAQAAERRRIRRASNPRASFAYVAAVIGLAVVVGAGIGLWGGFGGAAGAIGALSAALVLALGMIVAGLWRRRSGFLAFVTATTLAGGLIAGAASTVPPVTLGNTTITNYRSETVIQPFGSLWVGLAPVDSPRSITVTKGTGSTEISIDPGVELDLRASVGTATVEWMRVRYGTGEFIDSGTWQPQEREGVGHVDQRLSSVEVDPTTVQKVTISQQSGTIMVVVYEPEEQE